MDLFLRVAASPDIQENPEQFRAACQDLLGMGYPELQREIERYVLTGRFEGQKARRPTIADPRAYLARSVSPDEMSNRLAELALRSTGSPTANLDVRNRLERSPDLRLHEVLGAIALMGDENDEAREHLRQAVELGATNPATFRELARLEFNLVFGEFNLDYRMPPKRADDLRHLLKKSIECAPTQSTGYEMLAWVEASVEKPDLANVKLVQDRFNVLNDRPRTLLALALVRMRLGREKEAAGLLKQLEKLQPNDWVRYRAELTAARLENRPVDSARLPDLHRPGVQFTMPVINLPR
jgi:tetratricopeptide (TPR) repeat protein